MRTCLVLVAFMVSCDVMAWGVSSDRGPATTGPGNDGAVFLPDVFSLREGYRKKIDLDGMWEFRRDKEGSGKKRGWHEGKDRSEATIRIPGVPQAQGIGQPDGRQKHSFWEPFWIRRTFDMPALTASQQGWLRIGGIFPAAEIYLNGRHVGTTQSSRTQQRGNVTRFLKSGEANLIAIKVCDLPEIRLDGMFEWRELSMVWSGVYRSLALEITDRVSVLDVYVQPKLASKSVHVTAELSQPSAEPVLVTMDARDNGDRLGSAAIRLSAHQTGLETDVTLSGFTAWTPNHPKLYTLDVTVRQNENAPQIDRVPIRFGMREVHTTHDKFYLNGTPLYVRCFGDMQLYLDTIAPPADKNWYLPRLKRAQAYGFNMAKSCVEVFSQDFVEAADEAGIMIIQEFPFGVGPLRANRYKIAEPFKKYFSSELVGMVKETRSHPSVIAYSMSSELEFANQTQESFNFFSRDLCRKTRKLAPHALVIDCTGYLDTETTTKGARITDFYASIIPTWCKEVLDETPVNSDRKHPTVLHEFNWWSCYPDPLDKPKYADTQMLASWFDVAVQTARANGQEELIPAYRRISLRLQALCRKDGLEYARRCPNVEGYILWSLIDFHQYAEGLLDDFWEPKNVSAAEMLKSTGDTVIVLAREGNRCLRRGARSSIPLAISHYGENDLSSSRLQWKLSKGPIAGAGEIRVPALKHGELTQAGAVELDVPHGDSAFGFELEVALRHDGSVVNTNNWSFWAFPQVTDPWVEAVARKTPGATTEAVLLRTGTNAGTAIPANTALVVADSIDEPLADYVQTGGKCLLFSRGSAIENTACYYQTTTFYPLFRSIPWNAGPGNSGTVIANHPALKGFPHDEMCDLQFIWMIRGVLPMEFGPLKTYGVSPIIRAIDWYRENMNNAYLLEFKVGGGKVLATTLGVLPNVGKRTEADHLLRCLTEYAHSPAFAPQASVPRAEFLKWFSQRPAKGTTNAPNQLLK